MTPSLPLSRYSSFRSLDRVYLKTPQRCPILPERHICRVAFACIPSSGVQRSCALHLHFSGEWSSIFDFSDTPWPGVHTGGVGVGVPVVYYHMDDTCNTSIHRKRESQGRVRGQRSVCQLVRTARRPRWCNTAGSGLKNRRRAVKRNRKNWNFLLHSGRFFGILYQPLGVGA